MSSNPPRVVGFIGAGAMGGPMIARLSAAGFILRVYDTSPAALAAVGRLARCHTVPSAAEAARSADCVITMLPTGQIVQQAVLTGDSAAVHGLSTGSLLIDMSSSEPWETVRLGAALRQRGVRLVDAPVSGGVSGARNGTLAVVAGGDSADIEQARPLFDLLGSSVFHAGPLGAGHAVKALNNLLSAAGFAATIETLRIAQAYGVDPGVFTEIVNASSGSNNTTRNKLRQYILSGSYGSGFTIGLMAKDLVTARELARRHGVETPLSDHTADLWQAAAAELGPDADHTEYARTVRQHLDASTGRSGEPATTPDSFDYNGGSDVPVNIKDLAIRSTDFEPGGRMPDRHARENENQAPTLAISGVPSGAVELAVICHDPDAPVPYGFTHWTLYGIPASTTTVGPAADRAYRPGPNGYGGNGWGGPRPPAGHGVHHYYFWAYALDAPVHGTPTREEFLERYHAHIIEQNRVIGTYSR